jgi:bla regulator protein BlaR1
MSAGLLVASLGWTLLHFVWQGAVIGCAAAVVLLALRRARPETRYAVACGALLVSAAWPAVELLSLVQAGMSTRDARLFPADGGLGTALVAPGGWLTTLAWLQDHLDWVVGLWAACIAALAVRLVLGLIWINRAGETQAEDPVWQARLSAMAVRFGLDRDVRLRVVETLSSPVTAGCWRPVVLVPAALLSGMSPSLLEALLAHELGHIQRHDYLVNLCQNVIETLLFYHPAVWWISHRIRIEREQIADDYAARRLGEPRRLALALSELEHMQFANPHLAQAASGDDLVARIRRLLRPEVQALEWKVALPVLGLAMACAASAHALAPRDDGMPVIGTRVALIDFRTCVKPMYPQTDLNAGHEGAVDLAFLVARDGSVSASKVVQSSGYASLDEAARAAIAQCRFQPALARRQAVRQWAMVRYVWTLK